MFFRLILENANSDRIDMTTTANEYMTSSIEGLNPPVGTISTSRYAEDSSVQKNFAYIFGYHDNTDRIEVERKFSPAKSRFTLLQRVLMPCRCTFRFPQPIFSLKNQL